MVSPTREFVAILGFDEDVASRYSEVNGHGEIAPVEFLEQEFGWMEQSGICLEDCALVDSDVRWEQYITYLVQWAIDHSSPEYEGMMPVSFNEWCDCENENSDMSSIIRCPECGTELECMCAIGADESPSGKTERLYGCHGCGSAWSMTKGEEIQRYFFG